MMQLNYDVDDENRCENCGNEVSDDFIRVFGINGRIDQCPECASYREMKDGAIER